MLFQNQFLNQIGVLIQECEVAELLHFHLGLKYILAVNA